MNRNIRYIVIAWGVMGLGFDLACSRGMEVNDLMVLMRDGTELRTRIWTPGAGAYPVVLTRGYHVGGLGDRYASTFTDVGYVFVGQQSRGDGGVHGIRFLPDDEDGYDCIEWISKQPWCNGKIAMWGGSAYGATQWRAAITEHPNLVAIVPGFTNAEPWKEGYRSHGAIHLKMTTQSNRAISGGMEYSLEQWKEMLMYLPLIDMDREFLGREDNLWNDYISHSSYDDFWKALGMREGDKYKKINIPVYIMAGLKDYYSGAALESYNALKAVSGADEIRVRIADVRHSDAPDIAETIRWLDYILKGKDTGLKDEPPIAIQVRGGPWRYERQWPLEGTRFAKYYLSSPDGARMGLLTAQPPGHALRMFSQARSEVPLHP